MRDVDIRRALLDDLDHQHKSDVDTIVVEELGLCQGIARVDVAAVNGTIHGFEIKSERDTLARLEGQIAIYCRVLTHVTAVVAENHVARTREAVPDWWGITLAASAGDTVSLTPLRVAQRNPSVDPLALVQLLWRNETLAALEAKGLSGGLRSKPRLALWERLAASASTDDLILLVRDQLKRRPVEWRASLRSA